MATISGTRVFVLCILIFVCFDAVRNCRGQALPQCRSAGGTAECVTGAPGPPWYWSGPDVYSNQCAQGYPLSPRCDEGDALAAAVANDEGEGICQVISTEFVKTLSTSVVYFETYARTDQWHLTESTQGAGISCVYDANYTEQIRGGTPYSCPPGYTASGGSANSYCVRLKPEGCPVGDPIQCAGGEQIQTEIDYRAVSPSPLEFVRYYDSSGFYNPATAGIAYPANILGPNWRHSYQRNVVVENGSGSNPAYAYALRPNGDYRQFKNVSGAWAGRTDAPEKLTEVLQSGQLAGWIYTTSDASTENYDAYGVLQSITTREGRKTTLTYSTSSTPTSIAPVAGLLITVSDDAGRSMALQYDENSMLQTVTDPVGNTFSFGLDITGNVGTVNYSGIPNPRTYAYNESQYVNGNVPAYLLLTGVIDENQNRSATFVYGAGGLASQSFHGSSYGNVAVAYSSNGYLGTTAYSTVTTPLGDQVQRNFVNVNGILKDAQTVKCLDSACDSTVSSSLTYDSNGYVKSETDFNGNTTCYVIDGSSGLSSAGPKG